MPINLSTINPTSFTINHQSRIRVNKEEAIDSLTLIYNHSNEPSLNYEIKNLFVNIACNIIGKGGDENTILFMNEITIDKLYNHIKNIWLREYELSDAVKMGSDVVNFVKKNIQN